MERHCNTLLPAIRSRRHPYASINSFCVASAQLKQIALLYNLTDELNLDPEELEKTHYKHDLCTLSIRSCSSCLCICLDPGFKLLSPRRFEILPVPIRNKVWACLATRFGVSMKTIRSVVDLQDAIIQYGRVACLDGGDLMVGRDFVKLAEDGRDSSFVRVSYIFLYIFVLLLTFFFI